MSSLYLGDGKVGNESGDVFIGHSRVKELYKGAEKIWPYEEEGTVIIGQNRYGYTRIGDLYWTTENLRERIGVPYSFGLGDYMVAPGKDEKKYGLYYRLTSVVAWPSSVESTALKNILPEGWRLPTQTDFLKLSQCVDKYKNGAYKLLAVDSPTDCTYELKDPFGFKAYTSGFIRTYPDSTWNEEEQKCYLTHKYYSPTEYVIGRYIFYLGKNYYDAGIQTWSFFAYPENQYTGGNMVCQGEGIDFILNKSYRPFQVDLLPIRLCKDVV